MEFSMEQAQEVLDRELAEAETIVKSPSRVDEILMQLEEKMKAVPVIGSTLSDLPLMIAMVKAWIQKEYTVVSPKVIACLVGAILYLIRKKDLISDSIPLVGHVDDLAVMGLALRLSRKELDAFAQWREARLSGSEG
jgi:uncharacterized membrane protein YkvA (DUF1232 family)